MASRGLSLHSPRYLRADMGTATSVGLARDSAGVSLLPTPNLGTKFVMHLEVTCPPWFGAVGPWTGERPASTSLHPEAGHSISATNWRKTEPDSWQVMCVLSHTVGPPGTCEGLHLLWVSPCLSEGGITQWIKTPWQIQRDWGRKEKALYFCTFNSTFFLLFEQGVPHFHSVLGLTNSVASPVHSRF